MNDLNFFVRQFGRGRGDDLVFVLHSLVLCIILVQHRVSVSAVEGIEP